VPDVDQPQSARLCHAWCERNKGPILRELRRVLPAAARVLEVGSGSGQHAVFFGEQLANVRWQPSDINETNLRSIRAWLERFSGDNVAQPIVLDVVAGPWPRTPFDAVFSANMIHVTPWSCCLGLLDGARRCLVNGGLLLLYGPFRIAGRHTAESNRDFDSSLRKRNREWGVRDLEAVVAAARGFRLADRIAMPANNQLVVLRTIAEVGGS
jgi:SAM-dependent methyltransferase